MATSKKVKAKGHAILRSKATVRAPEFKIMDYKMSMLRALNYYSSEIEDKDKRKFALQYWKKQDKNVSCLSVLSDHWFSTVGAVAHMALNEFPLEDHDIIRLDNAYFQLVEIVNQQKAETVDSPKSTEPKKSVQDYLDDAAKIHIAEIENAIDNLFNDGVEFNVKNYLSGQQVKAPVAKRIADWFKPKLAEFTAAQLGDDPDLKEGYSHLGKRGLNKLVTFVTDVINDCGTVAQIARTTRLPPKRKEKSPLVLAVKMKFMREFVDLKLKSVAPDKIVGADQVWLYNTKYRRLIKYQALDGYTLTIKGSTIQNFDPEKSGSKILRKPDIQLHSVNSLTKRPMGALFNELTSSIGKVTGRVNEEVIILGAFI